MAVAFMFFFFFQAEDGIRDLTVTGVQTCALPIYLHRDPFDRYAAALRRRRNSSQVSVTPRVASPGTRNSSGTASTAEMAPHTTSAAGEIPNAAAKAITMASPRRRYSAPSTTPRDRKSTRLNSSHSQISYAVF